MSTTFTAGQPVPHGVFVSPRHLDVRVCVEDGQILPGAEGARYRRLPPLAALLLCPVLAGVYVMAFPLVILGSFVEVLVRHVMGFGTHLAGDSVDWGLYVAINRLRITHVGAPGEVLTGASGTRYLRIPTWLIVVGSPLVGAAFVLFFPVIMAAGLLLALGAAATKGVEALRGHAAPVVDHAWQPSASYLHKGEGDVSEVEQGSGDLDGEVRARRGAARAGDPRTGGDS